MDGADHISINSVLTENTVLFNKQDDATGIFDHVDAFVDLSLDNETVQRVVVFIDPHDDAAGTHRYAIWNKIAEGIGNLQALVQINISHDNLMNDEDIPLALLNDGDDPLAPDWEILACILQRLQRKVHLVMDDHATLLWNRAALPGFAGAIHEQAMITGFNTGNGFPHHCLDILCSALLTLPVLEIVSFEQLESHGLEEGQSLVSMVKLLQSPSLREVKFKSVAFTNTLSKAVAEALRERSEITDLRFITCSFPEGGSALIARVLETNTTLKYFHLFGGACEEVFVDVLVAALLSNSTLRSLGFDGPGSCSWLSPLFLALQENDVLKELYIDGIDRIDEELSTAMRLGLGNNSTLEMLNFAAITADNDTLLCPEAFSFLRTNTALKCLYVHFGQTVGKTHADTVCMEVLAMLRENESLESLIVIGPGACFEDYLVFIAAIQPNTTLNVLSLHDQGLYFEDGGYKDSRNIIPVLKKNYGLEDIPGLRSIAGDIRSILQLNRAGRRYLVQDGSSISKGVDVLSRVSNDINSVLLHLLENPRLCNRSAVETASIGNIDNARSTSPGNRQSCGNRQQQT
jgi:hypothetical protein